MQVRESIHIEGSNQKSQSKPQKIGKTLVSSLPLLCAIHCVSMPLVITALPFIGLEFLESELFEWAVLLVSISFAIFFLVRDFQKHKKILPLLVAVGGFSIITLGHLFHEFHLIGSFVGAVLILVSYLLNWQALRTSTQCAC